MQGNFMRMLAAMGLVLGLAACGVGGTNVAGGGTGGTGATAAVVVGTVSDKTVPTSTTTAALTGSQGSITVNGVEFAIDDSTLIRKDDLSVTTDNIFRGMIVEVRGTVNGAEGQAGSILVKGVIRGIIERNDKTGPNSGTLTIAGQTVVVDDLTRFNPRNPLSPLSMDDDRLQPGQFIEVYGLLRSPGVIAATYFESHSSTLTEVRGLVANLNPQAMTFTLGGLTVNYTNAVIKIPGGLRNGLFVEAEGGCSSAPVCSPLNASIVELETLGVVENGHAELEGFVTTFTSAAQFTVGNQAVVTSSATVYAGGTPSDLGPGVRIEVEGSLSGGVLTATKVIFKDSIEIEATAVNVGSNSFQLAGLDGITVTVTDETERQGFTDISAIDGQSVRLRGRASATTGASVIATSVEPRSSGGDATIVLQGPVQSFSAQAQASIVILGVTVSNAAAGLRFEDLLGNPISAETFFNSLSADSVVKAQGTFTSGSVNWEEAELEN